MDIDCTQLSRCRSIISSRPNFNSLHLLLFEFEKRIYEACAYREIFEKDMVIILTVNFSCRQRKSLVQLHMMVWRSEIRAMEMGDVD